MKICDESKRKPNQICNPYTGRWVFTHTKLGKEIAQLNLNTKNKNVKNAIFQKLLKKQYNTYSTKYIGKTNTRSNAFLYKTSLKSSKTNTIVKQYGKGDAKHIHIFIKISPLNCNKERVNMLSPSLKEIELYNKTNELIDNNILNSFVYCFNRSMLNRNWAKSDNCKYSVLLTEDITNFISFTDYLQSHPFLPDCAMFELLYTLHTLNTVGIKHMDLHGNNLYIRRLNNNERKVIKYEVKINDKFESFFVPTSHEIKVIDLDGGQKQLVSNKNIKQTYHIKINNPKTFTGNVSKKQNKSNIFKVVHTLMSIQPHIAPQLNHFGIRGNINIPFSTSFKGRKLTDVNYNKGTLEKYGIFVKDITSKDLQFLNLKNNIIWDINKIMKHIFSSGIFIRPYDYKTKYSQKQLFN